MQYFFRFDKRAAYDFLCEAFYKLKYMVFQRLKRQCARHVSGVRILFSYESIHIRNGSLCPQPWLSRVPFARRLSLDEQVLKFLHCIPYH